jgi:hypothetical protein
VSDKRLLWKEGNIKGNLIETRSISIRSSDLPPKELQSGREGSPSTPVVTKAASVL